MAELRIAHIIPYIGDTASGPAYSVPSLCDALQKNGCDVTLFCLKPLPKKVFNFRIKGYYWNHFWLIKNWENIVLVNQVDWLNKVLNTKEKINECLRKK